MADPLHAHLLDSIRDLPASHDPEAALTSLTNLARDLTASDAARIVRVGDATGADHIWLSAPILFRGELLGALQVSRAATGYSEEEIAALETIAALASFPMREQELQAKLEQTSHEKADLDRLKADFIAITSHELRTPLGLILGHATFLREVSTENHEHLDMIVRYATRLKTIVETLSNVDNYTSGAARVRTGQVSIPELVRETAALYEEQAKSKGVTIEFAMASPDLTVEGDAGKLGIALGNLISNAVAFSHPGGRVTVGAEVEAGSVKVWVRDEGIGIPSKDLSRVFERFYQVENHLTRKHGGMGLGLALAKAMIEMHGGIIWAESEVDKGSTFAFRLPLQ